MRGAIRDHPEHNYLPTTTYVCLHLNLYLFIYFLCTIINIVLYKIVVAHHSNSTTNSRLFLAVIIHFQKRLACHQEEFKSRRRNHMMGSCLFAPPGVECSILQQSIIHHRGGSTYIYIYIYIHTQIMPP